MLIHDTKIDYCVIRVYPDGTRFCMAKFMYEEDARKYKRSRKKNEFVKYELYERHERMDGVTWSEVK